MKVKTKEYIDQQINWVRDIKKMENTWMEKYLETEWRTEREARQNFNEMMDTWRKDQTEWRERIEQILGQTVPRKEMRASMLAIITILLTFLGLLVSIFFRK